MSIHNGSTRPWKFTPNFIVISGCSGGGKSTLLDELTKKGFSTHTEAGRCIVKSETAKKSDGLPWVNLNRFLTLTLEKNIENFLMSRISELTFFDRSIIDTIVNWSEHSKFVHAARLYRYSSQVFLMPPWKEIFIQDDERKHSFKDAVNEYSRLLIHYKKLGYDLIEIPKTDPKSRVKFILDHLNGN